MVQLKSAFWTKVLAGAGVSAVLVTSAAHAEFRDFEVAARMLHFIEGVPEGNRTLGVVADPSAPEAVAVAQELEKELSGGKTFENRTLSAKMISPSEIGSVDIVYVPAGLSQHHAMISAQAQQAGVLTITNDPACVESQNCVISIRRRARTEILWSRGAAEKASVGLGETLKALVDERP